jgi:hypothetical protein
MRRVISLGARVTPALVAAFLLATPAAAQTPVTQPRLTVEVITLQSVKIDRSTASTRLQYTRAGNKPTEFRASVSPTFDRAVWQPFSEGAVTTRLVNDVTWTTGFLTPSLSNAGTCGQSTIKIKAYLQFRGVNRSLQAITSNVVSDSLCVPFG